MCNYKLPNIGFFLWNALFIAVEPVTTAYLKKKNFFKQNRVFTVRQVFEWTNCFD